MIEKNKVFASELRVSVELVGYSQKNNLTLTITQKRIMLTKQKKTFLKQRKS